MKIIYTGSTGYLGQWYFTKCKTYDVHLYHLYERSVYYVIADNDERYYINVGNSSSLVDSLGNAYRLGSKIVSNFVTLEQRRDNQLNKVGI